MGLTRVLSIEGERNNVRVERDRAVRGHADDRRASSTRRWAPSSSHRSSPTCATRRARSPARPTGWAVASCRACSSGVTTGITAPALTAEMIAGRIAEIDDPATSSSVGDGHARRRGATVRGRCAPCSSRRLRCTFPDAVSGNGSFQTTSSSGIFHFAAPAATRPLTIASKVSSAPGRGRTAIASRSPVRSSATPYPAHCSTPGSARDHGVDLADRDLQPVADHDVLDSPEDAQAPVAQLGEVTGAEPPVVEGGGVVVGIRVPEEQVRAANAALRGVELRTDAHLDAVERSPVVGEPDLLGLAPRARGADRCLRRAVGAQHHDPVVVLRAAPGSAGRASSPRDTRS